MRAFIRGTLALQSVLKQLNAKNEEHHSSRRSQLLDTRRKLWLKLPRDVREARQQIRKRIRRDVPWYERLFRNLLKNERSQPEWSSVDSTYEQIDSIESELKNLSTPEEVALADRISQRRQKHEYYERLLKARVNATLAIRAKQTEATSSQTNISLALQYADKYPLDTLHRTRSDYRRQNAVDRLILDAIFPSLVVNICCPVCATNNHIVADHAWIPKVEGGNFVVLAKNSTLLGNLLPLCSACNQIKHAKPYDRWLASLGDLAVDVDAAFRHCSDVIVGDERVIRTVERHYRIRI